MNRAKITEAYRVICRELLKLSKDRRLRKTMERTPARAARALEELVSGYTSNFRVSTFPHSDKDQIIVVRGHRVYCLCPHHLMPVEMEVSVGYLPRERVLGLSKIPRMIDALAHRLTLQEELACQIMDYLNAAVSPRGAGVYIKAKHSCARARGARSTSDAVSVIVSGEVDRDSFLRCLDEV